MNIRRLLGNSLLCGVSLAVLTGAPLKAQTEQFGVSDIIVTAQKREQTLNEVGLTISAASADTLQERGVADISDLAKIVPGFVASQSTYATPVYTLRGIGLQDYSFAATPAVAVYVDEISRPFPLLQFGATLDLERVEVMKGPQGTLFGQSSTGGAINYIAAKPTDHLAAGLDLSYERFGRVDIGGFLSGPLSDTLQARLAVKASKGGAWQYSVTRPWDKNGATDQLMGRLLVDWEPTDRLRLHFNFNGGRDRSDMLTRQFMYNPLNIEPAAGSGNPYEQVDPAAYALLTDPNSPAYAPAFLDSKHRVYSRMAGVPWTPGAAMFPGDQQNAIDYLAGPLGNGQALCDGNSDGCIRQAEWNSDWPNKANDSYYQFALRADYDITDDVMLSSLTSYQKSNISRKFDLDATNAMAYGVHIHGGLENISEELRLTGKTGSADWILGANYDYSKILDLLSYHAPYVSSLETFPGMRFTDFTSVADQRIKSYAFFGNVEYKITDNLSLLAGLRYTNTKRKSGNCALDDSIAQDLSKTFGNTALSSDGTYLDLQTALGLDPAHHIAVNPGECYALNNMLSPDDPRYMRPTIVPYVQHLNEDNLSFRLGVNYKTDGGTLLYGTVSQGYKAGVITNIAPAFANQYVPAKQEKVLAFEAGVKAPLFDRRVQVNAAAFYYDYKDKQLRSSVLDPLFGIEELMINVPKSYIWGIEGDIMAEPVRGLVLSLSGTYLNSKVSDHFDSWNGGPIFNGQGYKGDFKGSPIPSTPKFSGTFDGQYQTEVHDNINAFLGSTITYTSRYNVTFQNDIIKAPDLFVRKHALVDVRFGLSDVNDLWRLTFYVNNLTSKYYEVSYGRATDPYYRIPGLPRIFGLRLSLRMK